MNGLTANGILLNRYHPEAALGQGSMGTVMRAHDALLDRQVAIKMLSDPRLGPAGRTRLLGEARAAARLNHPNIVAIYDVAEAGGDEAGAPGASFIVMEFVEGKTLHELGPLPLADLLGIARQVCSALEHAHAHGIIHRDLKPENVIITPDGAAKLMDFGLARFLSSVESDPYLTGTVLYLAPEQARGQAVDGRADLYALGVLLYEGLTGQLPFTGSDPLTILNQHINSAPRPPRQLRPDISPEMEAVILRLLAKDPNDRFATAREVRAALAAQQAAAPALSLPTQNPPHNLPAEMSTFVGRDKELAKVRHLLANARLLTLTGSGGTGKTRLALRAAADVLADFPDGVWLADMAPVTDAALVAQTAASVLGVRDEPGAALARRIADSLRHKSLLLILDNCEHVIAAAADLGETVLRGCPDVKLLATSREALGITGEATYRVPSLSLPPEGSQGPAGSQAGAAMGYEAVRLFVERAAAARPGFTLTEANVDAVIQICRQLDGVPLALELAAARLRALAVDQVAARLDDRFRLLTGGSRTALPRQQTLRALIDWSWDLLSADEKLLLRRLSVFVGGWNLEAAEYICGCLDEPAGAFVPDLDVLDLLARLVDKSLVVVETQSGEARYRLLETIRQYAREKLLEAGETESRIVRGRHLACFLAMAEAAEPALFGAAQADWLARLEAEHDNLRVALKWALSTSHGTASEEGLKLAGALARFWYLHGYWSEGRAWLRKALAAPAEPAASESMRRARARALAGLGWLMDENGDDIPLYEESLAAYRDLEDQRGMAMALRGLGASLVNQGEPETAAAHLEQALELFSDPPDAWGKAATLFSLGWRTFYQDDATGAEVLWNECLGLFRESGDSWGIAVTLGALGYVCRLRGDYAGAVANSEESLQHFRRVGDKAGIANSLARLGNVAFRRGDYQQAIALTDEGLALSRDLGEHIGLGGAFVLLGMVAAYQGEYGRAMSWLEQGMAEARESGDDLAETLILGYQGLTQYFAGQIEAAAALWQASLDRDSGNPHRLGRAFAIQGLGLAAWRRGDLVQAQALMEECLVLVREVGDRRALANAHNDLGQLALARGDAAQAQLLGRQALGAFHELGDRQGMAAAMEGLASALGAQTLAVRLFGAAEALRAALGAPRPPVEQPGYARHLDVIREALGQTAFDDAWREGETTPLDQILAEALA